jgi:tRNA/tmRNA/rRNA uracil-C5-methylase (TrmA/RlmC/RlmD family)
VSSRVGSPPTSPATRVGAEVEVDVGAVGHGGFCVARHEGLVVFVRHALPGERVRARITELSKRFARADAVEVLTASPHRVVAPCPVARPDGCGGCDWQHADVPYQRELKATVVAEQLRRLAGLERDVVVEPLPGESPVAGFGWRTRVRFAVDDEGRAGFRKARSHEVVAVDHCPIAHPLVEAVGVEAKEWNRAREVEVAASASSAQSLLLVTGRRDGVTRVHGGDFLTEEAVGRRWRVSAGAFWQVHPAAAQALGAAVRDGLAPRPGERAVDLYAGVGLFAGVLAQAVGASGEVVAVESSTVAAADARHNLADLPNVTVVCSGVAEALARDAVETLGRGGGEVATDIVVLDPPRVGAGPDVVRRIVALRPRAIAYVACDPAALARDLATFADAGYRLATLRAFDLFPQTHHVECVAILDRETG